MSRADREYGLIPEGSGRSVFIAGVLVVSLIVGLIMWINHKRPFWATERILGEQIRWCYKNRSDISEREKLDTVDGWGNPLMYVREVNPKLIVHGVRSAGPDGAFGTDDDMAIAKTDLNKSKIVGEWLGQKGKEVFKGVKEGVKKPSEFEPVEKTKTKKKWWKFGKKTAKDHED